MKSSKQCGKVSASALSNTGQTSDLHQSACFLPSVLQCISIHQKPCVCYRKKFHFKRLARNYLHGLGCWHDKVRQKPYQIRPGYHSRTALACGLRSCRCCSSLSLSVLATAKSWHRMQTPNPSPNSLEMPATPKLQTSPGHEERSIHTEWLSISPQFVPHIDFAITKQMIAFKILDARFP